MLDGSKIMRILGMSIRENIGAMGAITIHLSSFTFSYLYDSIYIWTYQAVYINLYPYSCRYT